MKILALFLMLAACPFVATCTRHALDWDAPPPAPVVDPCSVDPSCTALMLAGGRTPWCVGPRSQRCDP